MTSGNNNTTHKAATPFDSKVAIRTLPRPVAAKGTIVIKVKVSGINFADLHQLIGKFPLDPSGIVGLEAVGNVVEVGEDVTQFKIGDRVVSLGYASHAEYALLSELDTKVRRIPDSVSYETAAALALQGLTAITLIEEAYKVKKGDVVLVHAVAGGVGSLLAQLLHDKGAVVIGTTSSKEKAEFAKKNGADYVINYKEENILERVLEITKGEGVHAALDSVGGPGFTDSIKALRYHGTVVSFGNAAGPTAPLVVMSLYQKNIHVVGSALFAYFSNSADVEKWWTRLFDLISQDKLRATIYKTYTLDNIAQAFDDIEGGKTFGKLLITL